MSMNIKNDHVHEMAREAARRTGRSQTSVIEEALARLLDDLDRSTTAPDRSEEVARILADVDARLTDEDRACLTADDLYDERGLPA